MPPVSLYGMSETAGAATTWSMDHVKLYTCGIPLPGIEIMIDNPDKDG